MLSGSSELSHRGYSPAASGWLRISPIPSSITMHTKTVMTKNETMARVRVEQRRKSRSLSGSSATAHTTQPTPYTRNG